MAAGGMAAGVPALLALFATAGGGALIGQQVAVHQRAGARPGHATARVEAVQTLFVATGATAVVFWCWALYNVNLGVPDLGAVSFLFALVASGTGIAGTLDARTQPRLADSSSAVHLLRCRAVSLRRQVWLTGVSFIFVATNYLLGIGVVAARHGAELPALLLYFGVAAAAWAAAAVAGVRLLRLQIAHVMATETPDAAVDQVRQQLRWS